MRRTKPTRHAPEETDAYLASLPKDFRTTLRQLRARLAELKSVKKEDST